MSQTQEINRFSEASQKLLKDMDQAEIFELCANTEKLQCPDCTSFTEVVIIYCRCGRNLKYNRRPKPNLDCNSIEARDVLQSKRHVTESEEEAFSDNSRQVASTRKLPEFIEGPRHWWDDQHALERHDCTATKAERIRYSQKWVLSINAEGSQPPRQ